MIPDTLIIHCSVSSYGDVFLVDSWHKERNFRMICYHALILNGFPHNSKEYFEHLDGAIQPGRKVWTTGAHCRNGYNRHSWGVCMIGGYHYKSMFTVRQLEALKVYYENMDRFLDAKYRKRLSVVGHYECQSNKSCPDIPMDVLRCFLRNEIGAYEVIDEIQKEWDDRD